MHGRTGRKKLGGTERNLPDFFGLAFGLGLLFYNAVFTVLRTMALQHQYIIGYNVQNG